MKLKEYRILRKIDKQKKEGTLVIPFRVTGYKESTIDTVLNDLKDDGYISDVFTEKPIDSKNMNLDTLEITVKGYDAISEYPRNTIISFVKWVASPIIGSVIGFALGKIF